MNISKTKDRMSRTNKNTYKEQIKYNEKDWIQANHDTSATHAKI